MIILYKEAVVFCNTGARLKLFEFLGIFTKNKPELLLKTHIEFNTLKVYNRQVSV